jgi:hypothetical protein
LQGHQVEKTQKFCLRRPENCAQLSLLEAKENKFEEKVKTSKIYVFLYRVFLRFEQARFAFDGSILGSS